MKRLSLRLRLTILVTAAFVIALAATGVAARQQLQQSLIESARTAAENTLNDSFFAATTANSSSAIDGVTRIVLTDADGNELGEEAFALLLSEALAEDLAAAGAFLAPGVPATVEEFFIVDQEGAELPPGVAFGELAVADPIKPVGAPDFSETDTDIIVRQSALIGEVAVDIAVSTPRQPLDESLRAFTSLMLVLVPVLGALVALATWTTCSRVLRPVEAIRRQVAKTESDRLDQHVPRSGNGDEIDRLAGTMNSMLDRLRIAADKQRQFVSDASHELRSPITATLATLETTSANDASERWESISATLTREQTRLARLVDDLLFLASADEGAGPASDESVDLDELVLAEAQRPHGVNVEAHIGSPFRVVGNERLLRRCLTNLVDNAAHHADALVTVSIEVNPDGSATIAVLDDGPGVPTDHLDLIFERFTRIDDARNRQEGGAGLGLAIARHIAKAHNAELVATNRPEGGAQFELRFPPPDRSHMQPQLA